MKTCIQCGAEMHRKRFPSGRLESRRIFEARKFCDQRCMALNMQKDVCTSESHSRVKASRTASSNCELCGAAGRLHVHHVDNNPLNNSPDNLRTLCPSCHRKCHSNNFVPTGERRQVCMYCDRPAVKVGLCHTHANRRAKHGHPLAKKRKVGDKWVLMKHDGLKWLPFDPETP